MSEAKHTPGPWSLSLEQTWDGRTATNYYRVFDTNLNAICCEEYGAHNDGGNANMRLIAAAPEMYEALRSLENDAGQMPEFMWKMVQRAIAKAEGT